MPIHRLKTINADLENRTDTKVPFRKKTFVIHGITVEGVFPVFEGLEIKLDVYYMSDKFWTDNKNNDAACYREQMRAASRQLSKELKQNPHLVKQYTPAQLDAIDRGSDNVPGYTWHHKEDWLVMQLVATEMHRMYKHTGGSYTWNKKHFE